jgi:hypothetical protein
MQDSPKGLRGVAQGCHDAQRSGYPGLGPRQAGQPRTGCVVPPRRGSGSHRRFSCLDRVSTCALFTAAVRIVIYPPCFATLLPTPAGKYARDLIHAAGPPLGLLKRRKQRNRTATECYHY